MWSSLLPGRERRRATARLMVDIAGRCSIRSCAICEHFEVPHRYLLAATMAIQPVYWATSTSTIDFIWALGCFLLGFRLFLNDRYFGAAAMLGLAVGIRLSSVLLAGPTSYVATHRMAARRQSLGETLDHFRSRLVIGAALYVPEFVASGNSFAFLTYCIGAWTWADLLGRFIYKNVYFWGCRPRFFSVPLRRCYSLAGRRPNAPFARSSSCRITIVLALETLFLKIPVQRAYLLPLLPFVLILLGIAMRDRTANVGGDVHPDLFATTSSA